MPLAAAKQSFIDTLGSFGADYRNGSHDRAVADTFPASDPTTEQQPAGEPLPDDTPVVTAAHEGHHRVPVGGLRLRARSRLRRDHGDHLLHQHVEPAGDGRGGTARAEGDRARPPTQAVGQVVARAGLEGRDALLRAGRSADLPRPARLQHRGLRVHDLHRQLGPARRRDLGCDQRGRPRRLLGALGEPQLRGADPPRGEGELPRLTAARRRLRPRRPHGHRLRDGADRRRGRRRRRVPARHLAERARDRRDDRVVGAGRAVRRDLRRRLHRRRRLARASGARRTALPLGAGLDVRAAAALLRGDVARAGRRCRTSPTHACSSGWATR